MSYDIAGNKLEDVFFVYSVGNPLSKIEYPYVDYYEITPSEMFVELAMLGVFILTFMISLIIMVVRGIREIVKKLKRDVRIRTACGMSLFFIVPRSVVY